MNPHELMSEFISVSRVIDTVVYRRKCFMNSCSLKAVSDYVTKPITLSRFVLVWTFNVWSVLSQLVQLHLHWNPEYHLYIEQGVMTMPSTNTMSMTMRRKYVLANVSMQPSILQALTKYINLAFSIWDVWFMWDKSLNNHFFYVLYCLLPRW